jgi:hypothetical protein
LFFSNFGDYHQSLDIYHNYCWHKVTGHQHAYPECHSFLGSQLGPSPDSKRASCELHSVWYSHLASGSVWTLPTWFLKRSGRLAACFPNYSATPKRVVFAITAPFGKSRDSIFERFLSLFYKLFETAASDLRTTQRICSHRLFVNILHSQFILILYIALYNYHTLRTKYSYTRRS